MKLIALDLDGTLLNHKREISLANINAIKHAQKLGIEVALSTGRHYSNVKSICEKVHLNTYIISNNGGAIHDKKGKQINSTFINKKDISEIIKWFEQNNFYYEVGTNDKVFCPIYGRDILKKETLLLQNSNADMISINKTFKFIQEFSGYEFVKNCEELLAQNEDYYNVLALSFIDAKLDMGRNYFSKSNSLALFSSFKNNFELVNKDTSKGKAVERLCNLLKISLQETAAVGDNYNDVSMFEKVGLSVAMGNADDTIKSMCKYVTKNNEEDGVAHIIYKLIDEFHYLYKDA